MSKIGTIHLFYSWQSDSPKKTNQEAIRNALRKATKSVAAERVGTKIVADEATRDTSGSPNISSKILEKIQRADIFVADITSITPRGSQRPCPNPNVTFELGYAVGELGWDRIILLFNKAQGSFPQDLPFDFAQHRAASYQLAETDDPKMARSELEQLLKVAVRTILDKAPKRPAEVRGLSREKLEHDHDVENMTWLMSTMHLPTLDEHISDLPHSISYRALWFWESFKGVAANSLFSVYDPILRDAVDSLFSNWDEAVSHGVQYDGAPGAGIYIFTSPGDAPLSNERQQIWDKINKARSEMRWALDKLLKRIRDDYIEISLKETNARAWNDYVTSEKEMRKRFNFDEGKPKKAKSRKKKS